jgi:regulatory subunit for Cdc7p protein kinase
MEAVSNATHSPLRVSAANVTGERQSSHANEQRDIPYGQPPPKKPIVEVDDAVSRHVVTGRVAGVGCRPPL